MSSSETDQQQQQQTRDDGATPGDGSPTRGRGFAALKDHILANKLTTALWASRALTLLFCVSYIIPIFSNPASSYQKVLLSNAATSALRLQQRIPSVQFSRQFLNTLLMEDSAHYLFYSVIFMYCAPMTMVLVPIFLFALLHFASYSQGLLDIMGQNNALVYRFFISLVEFQQRNMLRGSAFVEIVLMPLTIVMLFMGKVSMLTPFIYHRFLVMRYSSRRNAYTRNMFYELRATVEYAVNRPSIPGFLKNAVFRAIAFISNISPPIAEAQ